MMPVDNQQKKEERHQLNHKGRIDADQCNGFNNFHIYCPCGCLYDKQEQQSYNQ